MNLPFRRSQGEINRCYAILAGTDPAEPITQADIERGREIGAAMVYAAQCHPTLGESLRLGAGYSWVL